jgi:hypothetical protein
MGRTALSAVRPVRLGGGGGGAALERRPVSKA